MEQFHMFRDLQDFGQTVDTIFVCLYPIQRRYLTFHFPWWRIQDCVYIHPLLVGGFNPSEKYDRQIGSFPQGSGWKYKIFELPPPRLECKHVEIKTPVSPAKLHFWSPMTGTNCAEPTGRWRSGVIFCVWWRYSAWKMFFQEIYLLQWYWKLHWVFGIAWQEKSRHVYLIFDKVS